MSTLPRVQRNGYGNALTDQSGTCHVILLADAENLVTAHRITAWRRLRAWCAQFTLDAELAAGASPDTDLLRAVRATTLVTLAERRELADDWERLLAEARRPVRRRARVLFRRDQVLAVEHDVREMLSALSAPLPVPARGVAMARTLLTDGTGPLYNRSHPRDLGDAVREATRQLDPATALSAEAAPSRPRAV
jgi:hypothetical protein